MSVFLAATALVALLSVGSRVRGATLAEGVDGYVDDVTSDYIWGWAGALQACLILVRRRADAHAHARAHARAATVTYGLTGNRTVNIYFSR